MLCKLYILLPYFLHNKVVLRCKYLYFVNGKRFVDFKCFSSLTRRLRSRNDVVCIAPGYGLDRPVWSRCFVFKTSIPGMGFTQTPSKWVPGTGHMYLQGALYEDTCSYREHCVRTHVLTGSTVWGHMYLQGALCEDTCTYREHCLRTHVLTGSTVWGQL